MQVTTIGAFPKPKYVPIPGWFLPGSAGAAPSPQPEPDGDRLVERGIHEVVADQVNVGVDIPTDGEIRRENYIHYHCRHLAGIDFDRLTEKVVRNGTWRARLPTFVSPIAAHESFLDRDFRIAQSVTKRPIKMTVPGPLTIMDSTADGYYGNELDWGHALARALNREVLALAAAGCRHIQVDGPMFARYPEAARSYGFELLEEVLAAVPDGVTRTLHVCCGYPDRLDNPDYPKADSTAYLELADLMEGSSIDAVSLEDAHRANPSELFEAFATTTVILGSVEIASSRVESIDEIAYRAEEVLAQIPGQRMVLAPDCGLGFLSRELALAKLANLRAAADRLPVPGIRHRKG